MIWETPRLYLRELTEADLPQLLEMMNGQRNFYERQFSQAELQNWLARQQQRYSKTLASGVSAEKITMSSLDRLV